MSIDWNTPCRKAFEKWLVEVKDLAFAERGAWEAWEAAWTVAAQSEPEQWYCDEDPEERGDTPYECMFPYRPRLEPIKIHGASYGPTKWGVMARHPTEDGEEAFVFDTEEEAQAFCDNYPITKG